MLILQDLRRVFPLGPRTLLVSNHLDDGEVPAVIASDVSGSPHRFAAWANTVRVSISHGLISLSRKDDHDDGPLRRLEPYALAFTTCRHIT